MAAKSLDSPAGDGRIGGEDAIASSEHADPKNGTTPPVDYDVETVERVYR